MAATLPAVTVRGAVRPVYFEQSLARGQLKESRRVCGVSLPFILGSHSCLCKAAEGQLGLTQGENKEVEDDGSSLYQCCDYKRKVEIS